MLGGGRGGRIRGAISRSLVVVVMGLGVEGPTGGGTAGSGGLTGPVEDGAGIGSTAIGVVGVSRGLRWNVRTPLKGFQRQNPQEGGWHAVKADTEEVLCGGEGSVVAVAGMEAGGGVGQGGGQGGFRQRCSCLRGN